MDYATYHLLGEPETTIEHTSFYGLYTRLLDLWRVCLFRRFTVRRSTSQPLMRAVPEPLKSAEPSGGMFANPLVPYLEDHPRYHK